MTTISSQSVDDINVDATFKVSWAGFLRLGEITYIKAQQAKPAFADLNAIRQDVSFAKGNQYAMLRLKRSKTDVNHTGVNIILAATNDHLCPVSALLRLFAEDPQPPTAPLFRLGTAFSRTSVVQKMRRRINMAGIQQAGFSGHSFRKGAAQHASDRGMLNEDIQRLGKWSSNAFQLYFQTSTSSLFNLNLTFQKGIPLAVPRAPIPYTTS